jgi:hypothetical protein
MPLHVGHVRISPTVMLPIVDCRKWRVMHGAPECVLGRDVNGCAACEVRESREGNLREPPVLGTEPRPAAAPAFSLSAEAMPAEPQRQPWRGMGDVVASATKLVGIQPCGGCQRRREALNRLMPFSSSSSPQEPSPAPTDAIPAPTAETPPNDL